MNDELRVQRYDFFLIYAREVGVRKLEKGALFFLCCSLLLICGVFIGYSWSIHGVFMGYSYVSVMYRLCIGYVSVMCRLYIGTDTALKGEKWKVKSERWKLKGEKWKVKTENSTRFYWKYYAIFLRMCIFFCTFARFSCARGKGREKGWDGERWEVRSESWGVRSERLGVRG